MGGASTQIAVLKNQPAFTNSVFTENDMVLHSFLGYGVNEFTKAYNKHAMSMIGKQGVSNFRSKKNVSKISFGKNLTSGKGLSLNKDQEKF